MIWEGIKAAADPTMFPEQLTGPNALSTWRVKKAFSGGSFSRRLAGRGRRALARRRVWRRERWGDRERGHQHDPGLDHRPEPVGARSAAARNSGRSAARQGKRDGASAFGGDAFSRSLTSFLHDLGREPSDLTFANARDAAGATGIEVGVFDLPGAAGTRLLEAIVAAGRPNAPVLVVSRGTLAGERLTSMAYPGGSILSLRASDSRVFCVGAPSEQLAATVLRALP